MNKIKSLLIKLLLKIFHKLPDWLKLYLRSFKKHESELYELHWLVSKDTIAVDIGANKGAYTYALSKVVGKKGLVISIEPIKELATYIARTCLQLKLPVEVKQCCLSDKEGEGALFIPVESGELQTGLASLNKGHHENDNVRKVKVRRLDDVLKQRDRKVSFIKCDVEGHEMEVFRGALDILKNDRPNVLVEIEQRHCEEPIESRFKFFEANGYIGFYLRYVNGIRELKKIDLAWLINSSPQEKKNVLDSVINFIFLPAESADSIKRHFKKIN